MLASQVTSSAASLVSETDAFERALDTTRQHLRSLVNLEQRCRAFSSRMLGHHGSSTSVYGTQGALSASASGAGVLSEFHGLAQRMQQRHSAAKKRISLALRTELKAMHDCVRRCQQLVKSTQARLTDMVLSSDSAASQEHTNSLHELDTRTTRDMSVVELLLLMQLVGTHIAAVYHANRCLLINTLEPNAPRVGDASAGTLWSPAQQHLNLEEVVNQRMSAPSATRTDDPTSPAALQRVLESLRDLDASAELAVLRQRLRPHLLRAQTDQDD